MGGGEGMSGMVGGGKKRIPWLYGGPGWRGLQASLARVLSPRYPLESPGELLQLQAARSENP